MHSINCFQRFMSTFCQQHSVNEKLLEILYDLFNAHGHIAGEWYQPGIYWHVLFSTGALLYDCISLEHNTS